MQEPAKKYTHIEIMTDFSMSNTLYFLSLLLLWIYISLHAYKLSDFLNKYIVHINDMFHIAYA